MGRLTHIFKTTILNAFSWPQIVMFWFMEIFYCNWLWPIDAIGWHITQSTLACCTKPLHETMLTYHLSGSMTFVGGQFHKRYINHQSLKLFWKSLISNNIQIFWGSELILIDKHYRFSKGMGGEEATKLLRDQRFPNSLTHRCVTKS